MLMVPSRSGEREHTTVGARRAAGGVAMRPRRSAAHEQDEPGDEEQREDDLAEAHGIDPAEERDAREHADEGGNGEAQPQMPHLARQQPGPLVATENQGLVHHHERLEVRLHPARCPPLRHRIDDDRRRRRADRASQPAGQDTGAAAPPATRQALGEETADLEEPDQQDEHPDQPVAERRPQAGQGPAAAGRRAQNIPSESIRWASRGWSAPSSFHSIWRIRATETADVLSAISRASSRAVASNASGATTRLTRRPARASSAENTRPVNAHSAA